MIALAIVAFFVKRDYARLGDFMQTSLARQAATEAVLRQLVTVAEHRESMTGVHRKFDESIGGVHRKVDTLHEVVREELAGIHTRVVVLETKQDVREDREKDPEKA